MKYDIRPIESFDDLDNQQKYWILQNAKHLITHLYYTQDGFDDWTVTEDLDEAMQFIKNVMMKDDKEGNQKK